MKFCLAVLALGATGLFDGDEGSEVVLHGYLPNELSSVSKTHRPEVGVCGKYALGQFLHLHNWDASKLEADLPESSATGFSLLDLRDAAVSRGMSEATVVQCAPETTDHLPLPFLMHLEASQEHPDGHFIVVLGYPNSSALEIYDPRWRTVFETNRTDLFRTASGYYLVSKSSNIGITSYCWTIINFIALVLLWATAKKKS